MNNLSGYDIDVPIKETTYAGSCFSRKPLYTNDRDNDLNSMISSTRQTEDRGMVFICIIVGGILVYMLAKTFMPMKISSCPMQALPSLPKRAPPPRKNTFPYDLGSMTDFEAALNEDGTIVLLHADWCPHCQTMKPKFKNASAKSDKKFCNIDIEKLPENVLQENNIDAIPTVAKVQGKKLVKYDGAKREEDDIVNFANS